MNEDITVDITSLGNRVGGISSLPDRKTVFVMGALPGERVRCRPVRIKKNLIEAELQEVLDQSPYRTDPFCRHFGECGGCSLQNLDYSRQLYWKRNWVQKALSRSGIEYPDNMLSAVRPSPSIAGYRSRVSFDFRDGRPGLHRFRGDTMPVENCPLLNSRGQEVFKQIHEQTLRGIRRVCVRASDSTGSVMLEFSSLPEQRIEPLSPGDVTAWKEDGIWRTDPPGGVFHEVSGSFIYPIRPGAFNQVNTGCSDVLISSVIACCGSAEKVLDLYGGCGTFALPLASEGAKVTSVELNPDSSASGREAAGRYGISGINFLTGRARHFLLETIKLKETWDSVIVDPPRTGLGIRVSRLLRRILSDRIVYVSCNPFSLARDLSEICEFDWEVAVVQPVDMFPQTDHVETVVELKRKENR
jgi:23S rRNA (uracil1939-C5)-methyltransferase